MRGKKHNYREPLLVDEYGLYVTVAQMGFFMNRSKGQAKFRAGDTEFLSYYKNCCLYNLVYDMMEDNPTCAKMYWDSEAECISLTFPVKGFVARALAEVGHVFQSGEYIDDDDEDEDIYGIFS